LQAGRNRRRDALVKPVDPKSRALLRLLRLLLFLLHGDLLTD
jgi:hypothetical protein